MKKLFFPLIVIAFLSCKKDDIEPAVRDGAPVMVHLSALNPPSQAVSEGSAAEFCRFVFRSHAEPAADAFVTELTLERGGISADASVRRVELLDKDRTVLATASLLNGRAVFSSPRSALFTVRKGQSFDLIVRAVLASGAAGQTMSFALTQATAAGNAPIFPNLHGSTMAIAGAR